MIDPGKEILSIVDENDCEIGRGTLREIHTKGHLHREAHVYIINGQGQILLQKRADNKLWDTSSAGHFSPDEDYLDGALRECSEELGVHFGRDELRFLGKARLKRQSQHISPEGMAYPQTNNIFAGVFLLRKDIPLSSFNPDPIEVNGLAYFTKSDLESLLKTDGMTSVSKEIIMQFIMPFFSGEGSTTRNQK